MQIQKYADANLAVGNSGWLQLNWKAAAFIVPLKSFLGRIASVAPAIMFN